MTSPSKIAAFCPHVLAARQAWKLSAHGKKEQKPAKKGGKEAEGEERKRRTGKGEATQLELGGCQEASDDLQVHSAQVAAWSCGVNIQPWEAQALGLWVTTAQDR